MAAPVGARSRAGFNSLGLDMVRWVLFGVFGFGVLGQLFLYMHALYVQEILTFSLWSLLAVTCSVSGCRTDFKLRYDVVLSVWMRSPCDFLFFQGQRRRVAHSLPKTLTYWLHTTDAVLHAQVFTVNWFT